MEVSMSEIIRETRNAINSRLDMLEVLVKHSTPMSNVSDKCDTHYSEYLGEKYNMIESTMYKFNDLLTNIQIKIESMEKQNTSIIKAMGDTSKCLLACNKCHEQIKECICDMPSLVEMDEIIPEIVIEYDATKKMNDSQEYYCDDCSHYDCKRHLVNYTMNYYKKSLEDNIKKFTNIVNENEINEEEQQDEEEHEYCDECGGECDGAHGASGENALKLMKSRGLEVKDNKVQSIINEIAEEEEEEVAEEEEEVDEEEEEEGESLELEEFEYKGMTLYHDHDNKVYRMDEDGGVSEPLGIWDEKSKKIKKL